MYSKENWQSMAEKEPPFGYDDNFQTSPSLQFLEAKYPFIASELQRQHLYEKIKDMIKLLS